MGLTIEQMEAKQRAKENEKVEKAVEWLMDNSSFKNGDTGKASDMFGVINEFISKRS